MELFRASDDVTRLAALTELAAAAGLPLVAAGDVHMHVAQRRALQDTVTAIRLGVPVAEAGVALHPNGERHLRERADLMKLDDITIPVAAIDDLISLKRQAGRPQDLEDIRALEVLRDIS